MARHRAEHLLRRQGAAAVRVGRAPRGAQGRDQPGVEGAREVYGASKVWLELNRQDIRCLPKLWVLPWVNFMDPPPAQEYVIAETETEKEERELQSQPSRRITTAVSLVSGNPSPQAPAPNSWSRVKGVITVTKMTLPAHSVGTWSRMGFAARKGIGGFCRCGLIVRPHTESHPGGSMRTRVIATARLNATCRRELCQQFGLSMDPASELRRLNPIIGSGQLTLPDLRQLIGAQSVNSVLSALAPAEFSRVRAHVEGGSRSALETTAADLQAELAETLMVATTVVTAATREMTAKAIAESGLKLGYTVTTHHAESATCVELCREHETVLVRVHDGGNLEFDHTGPTGCTYGEHQLQLERAAKRYGVFIAQRLSGHG